MKGTTVKPYLSCPVCEEESPYVNAGRVHVGYCQPCGVSFIIGTNLFSSWRDETEDEQRAAYAAAGIQSLRRLGAMTRSSKLADKLLGPAPAVIELEPF
jgi:hypothetical protein